MLLRLFLQSLPHMNKLPKPCCSAYSSCPLEKLPRAALLRLLLRFLPTLEGKAVLLPKTYGDRRAVLLEASPAGDCDEIKTVPLNHSRLALRMGSTLEGPALGSAQTSGRQSRCAVISTADVGAAHKLEDEAVLLPKTYNDGRAVLPEDPPNKGRDEVKTVPLHRTKARRSTAGLLAGQAAQGPAVLPPPPAPASPGQAAKAVLLHLLFQSLPQLDKLSKAMQLNTKLMMPCPHRTEARGTMASLLAGRAGQSGDAQPAAAQPAAAQHSCICTLHLLPTLSSF